MRGSIYDNWVKSLKEGDLVLAIDNHWSSPVIFLSWNGDSASNGYRSQHLYIPDWDHTNYWHGADDPQKAADEQWESTLTELEKHGARSRRFEISTINAHAEKRYFPFPKKFLTKNQIKFIKLINKIKGYEY